MLVDSEFPAVNRSILTVKPTKVYLEWARHNPDEYPELTLEQLLEENTAYLVPCYFDSAEAQEILESIAPKIFESELAAWCRETEMWPKDRSYKEFTRWFDFEFHSIIYDTTPKRKIKHH